MKQKIALKLYIYSFLIVCAFNFNVLKATELIDSKYEIASMHNKEMDSEVTLFISETINFKRAVDALNEYKNKIEAAAYRPEVDQELLAKRFSPLFEEINDALNYYSNLNSLARQLAEHYISWTLALEPIEFYQSPEQNFFIHHLLTKSALSCDCDCQEEDIIPFTIEDCLNEKTTFLVMKQSINRQLKIINRYKKQYTGKIDELSQDMRTKKRLKKA